MKGFCFVLSIIAIAYSSVSIAAVSEIRSMRETFSTINTHTLVVFDIDNTITEPLQTIGSDQFFSYLVEVGKSHGLSEKAAVEQALQQASLIQPVSRVRPVESGTPGFIANLQRNGIPIVALTSRPLAWAAGTLRQLGSIQVNFMSAERPPNPYVGGATQACTFIQGVLFLAPGHNKGDCLIAYVNETRLHPDRIVFIDDKVKNVNDVEAALTRTSSDHFSFRYGAADAKVAAFDRKLAEFEWAYFLRFRVALSDQDAYRLMRSQLSSQASAISFN